jgi:hypothetical protein
MIPTMRQATVADASQRRALLYAFLTAWLGSSVGCTQQGRLLVVVDSNIADLSAVSLRVRRSIEPEGESTDFTLSRDPLPLRLGVEPTGGSGLVRIEAVGSRGSAPAVESVATINILPGPTRVWHMYLDARCEGVLDCAEDETCAEGVCEPVHVVQPEELPLLGVDGGTPLDARVDAVTDASTDAPVVLEVCNDSDDDGDGRVDEGFMIGMPCDGADSDECTEGALRCRSLEDVACDDETSGSVEACNGTDDDCDGATDESLTRPCSDECGAGAQSCSAGSWGECAVCPGTFEGCSFAGSCTFSTGCSGTYHCCNNVGSATGCPGGQVFRSYSNCSRTPCTRYNLCCAN